MPRPIWGPAFRGLCGGRPGGRSRGHCRGRRDCAGPAGDAVDAALGSAWYDVESQITAVTEKGLDPRNFILCTDDCHSGTLVNDGHMNRVVRHAIACGCDPLVALQMATINTATHFGLERELGSIAPGRRADVILTSDLTTLPIEQVIARGKTVARWRDPGRLPASTTGPTTARKRCIWARCADRRRISRSRPLRAPTAVTRQCDRRGRKPGADQGADGRIAGARTGWSKAQGDTCQIALVERHRATGGGDQCLCVGLWL